MLENRLARMETLMQATNVAGSVEHVEGPFMPSYDSSRRQDSDIMDIRRESLTQASSSTGAITDLEGRVVSTNCRSAQEGGLAIQRSLTSTPIAAQSITPSQQFNYSALPTPDNSKSASSSSWAPTDKEETTIPLQKV